MSANVWGFEFYSGSSRLASLSSHKDEDSMGASISLIEIGFALGLVLKQASVVVVVDG